MFPVEFDLIIKPYEPGGIDGLITTIFVLFKEKNLASTVPTYTSLFKLLKLLPVIIIISPPEK